MSKIRPRVSIGLPVFNGEEYLEEALNSILAQAYQDFELIISDNASTDRTPQICREYSSRDSRISYYRNRRNLGASANFNRVFKLSSGEYFKWVAHDDVLAPDFLSKCIEVLDRDPSIVLCHSKTAKIDERGKLVGAYNFQLRVDSPKPHERFGDIISEHQRTGRYSWVLLFGVIRASSLKRTSLFGYYVGADKNLLAELCFLGRIYQIPEYLFFRRSHPKAYTEKPHSSLEEQLKWWTQNSGIYFTHVKRCLEYLRSIRRASLTFSERLLCYAQLVKFLVKEGWIFIGFDVGMRLLKGSSLGHNLIPVVNRIFKLFGLGGMR